MRELDVNALEHLADLAGLEPEAALDGGMAGRLAAVERWLAVLDAAPEVPDAGPRPGPPPRADDPLPGLDREAVLASAPRAREGFFSAPPLRGRESGPGGEASAAAEGRPDPIVDPLNCWRELADSVPDAAAAPVPAPDAPLRGLGVALKANICCPGLPADCCSRILAGWRPPYAATAVERLLAAGARILGTTNMDEFAMGSSTENSAFGPTRNPAAPQRVPGGSSGGAAAAVAAGLADFALGSDTGGSVRQPAHCCGVVGLKPTYGRISRFGLVAFASSLDQIGPLAPTVERCAAVYAAIAGSDPRDATSLADPVGDPVGACSLPAAGLKAALPRIDQGAGVEPGVAAACEAAAAALRDAGVEVFETEPPPWEEALAAYHVLAAAEASANLARYDGSLYGARPAGAGGGWADVVRAARSRGFGPEVRLRILLGTYVLSAGYGEDRYRQALRTRAAVAARLDALLDGCDAIALPTSPRVAFPIGRAAEDPLRMYRADSFTVPANLAGLPAISVPAGRDPSGLPVGFQLIGRRLGEETLFRLAAAMRRELAGREGA